MFENEIDRFEWLIDTLLLKAKQVDVSRLTDPNNIEVMLVATGLVERALSYSSAIRTLIINNQTADSQPLQRAIYELWIEHKYLLSVGEPLINAIKAQINANFEAIEFAEARPESFSSDRLDGIKRNIDFWSIEHPNIIKEIRDQRKKRRFHWSGVSRSQMERAVMPAPEVYQMLSWEAHAVLSPIRDVEFFKGDSEYRLWFEPRNTPTVNPEWVSYFAGGILYYMWNSYAEFFGLPSIELPV
ncbi:MAG: DUF5677 domain-containing protein [Thermodesulfobacteriota bacterium]